MLQYMNKYTLESVAVLVTLFPIVVMLYRMDYRHSVLKYLFWCLLFKFSIDVVMLIMASKHINNLFLYNTYVLASYAFVATMFYRLADKDDFKLFILVVSVVFFLSFCMDWFYWGKDRTILFASVLQCLLIVIFVILYFWEVMKSLKVEYMLDYAPFWVISGLLLNYASLTFVVIVFNQIDRWGASQELRMVAELAPVFESFSLCWIGFGLLKSK